MSIETTYHGTVFRSRLEATWAALFDQLGIGWTYEPFDGRGYIPDFLLHGQMPTVVEVRPATDLDGYLRNARAVRAGLADVWDSRTVVVGVDPLQPAAGLYANWAANTVNLHVWVRWVVCPHCRAGQSGLALTLDAERALRGDQFWMWPCGHHEHVDYLDDLAALAADAVRVAWPAARNATRWTARR